MAGLYQELKQRGFLYQCTDEENVSKLLDADCPATFYVGFDPTASSLHVGSLIPILAMVHLQKAGHKPIAVVGGGTGLVGDPSGKTEMRKVLTLEKIEDNARGLHRQLSRFLDLDGVKGKLVNNADWLTKIGYIEFLRDVGRHFSVNKMLSAESYKSRLETGLSFLEFNYMLLQAYDFLKLFEDENCVLQMGGQDQWGNIVAGSDLIRRKTSKQAYGLTFPLLLDSSGNKIGKSVAGAVWLDSDKMPVFDFYQFWRNTEDDDVERFLKLFTFLPVEECRQLGALQPPQLNRAKEILAYEVTRIVHGKPAADEAYRSAIAHFPSADTNLEIATSSEITKLGGKAKSNLPVATLSRNDIGEEIPVAELFVLAGLCKSKGEAKRLIKQGGGRINDEQIRDFLATFTPSQLEQQPVLKAGKKRMVQIHLD